jgi:hypothetical protein
MTLIAVSHSSPRERAENIDKNVNQKEKKERNQIRNLLVFHLWPFQLPLVSPWRILSETPLTPAFVLEK